MLVDLIKLHEKTYGYAFRSGKRGSYKYWYRDSETNKIYQGNKPEKHIVEQYEKREQDPDSSIIIENPWENYNSNNTQLIFAKKSGVPFNKLGLTQRDELEYYESYLLSIAYRRIFENLKTFPDYYLPINSSKIMLLHRIVFFDIYSWAGQVRTINVSKEGFPFPPASLVVQEMIKLDKNILNKINYNMNASLEQLADLLGSLSADLTIVHPFREGNGRIIRLVMDIISLAFGYQSINWSLITTEEHKNNYLNCMFAAYSKNYNPLIEFTYDLLASSNS